MDGKKGTYGTISELAQLASSRMSRSFMAEEQKEARMKVMETPQLVKAG